MVLAEGSIDMEGGKWEFLRVNILPDRSSIWMISFLCFSKLDKTLGGTLTHACCHAESPIIPCIHVQDNFEKHLNIPGLI